MKKEGNRSKKYLVLTTYKTDAQAVKTMRGELAPVIGDVEIISTAGLTIRHCIGCNDCWIKTPGICCIHDDYEPIFIKLLQADVVILLTETKLGFVCSSMKNAIDRILPMLTMHLKYVNGQMRHYLRYDKAPRMALIYLGEADNGFLNRWLGRVQINLNRKPIGAYSYDHRKELYHELGNY